MKLSIAGTLLTTVFCLFAAAASAGLLDLPLLDILNSGNASTAEDTRPAATDNTSDTSVRIRRVSFEVQNVNRSLVACLSDGKTYTIQGQIVFPRGTFNGGDTIPAATLYLHGLNYGKFFWRFRAGEGMDYAVEQARLGHTSVVIDRLGYDNSDQPNGFDTCVGAQADITHQIINQLRSGSYQLRRGRPRQFQRVALAGHSAGGLIAQVTAYSFGNMDALAVISYGDLGASTGTLAAVTESVLICVLGGQPAEPGEASGYAFFGQTDQAFRTMNFFDATPRAERATTRLRNRDPCGDFASLPTGLALDAILIGSIDVPVLIVCGQEDAVFPPPACQIQSKLYIGTTDLTTSFIEGIGHAIALERRAPVFRSVMSNWLSERGF